MFASSFNVKCGVRDYTPFFFFSSVPIFSFQFLNSLFYNNHNFHLAPGAEMKFTDA